MGTNTLTVIIVAALSSPSIVLLFNKLVSSRKDSSDIQFVNVQGEEKAVGIWKQLFDQAKLDKEELRAEFTNKINELKQDHLSEITQLKEEFHRITFAKDNRIRELEQRVDAQDTLIGELQIELSKYQSMGAILSKDISIEPI